MLILSCSGGELIRHSAQMIGANAINNSPFVQAIEEGNQPEVEHMMSSIPDVNARFYVESVGANFTPLQLAAANGYRLLVIFFLNHGAAQAIDKKTEGSGRTALHLAVGRNHFQTVEVLLNSRANCNAQIESGADAGKTPLHLAVEKNNYSMVQLLIDRGATINIADNRGKTPLDLAGNNREIIELLRQNRLAATIGSRFTQALSERRHGDIIRMIEADEIKVNDTIHGSNCLNYLLAHQGNQREEIIMAFIRRSDPQEWEQALNAHDARGQFTALHVVAQQGYRGILALLLYGKASLDVLHNQSIRREDRKEKMGEMAVQHMHSAITLLDENRRTPLHLAAENGHKEIVKELVEFAALVESMSGMRKTTTGEQWTSYVEKEDIDGASALQLARDAGHKEIVKYLQSLKYSPTYKRVIKCCHCCFKHVESVNLSFNALGAGAAVGMKFNSRWNEN